MTTEAELNAATPDSTAATGRRVGTWRKWGPRRRRLIALIVLARLAMGAVVIVGALLGEVVLAIAGAVAAMSAKIWLDARLDDVEEADGAWDDAETPVLLPDEQYLLEDLDAAEAESGRKGVTTGARKVLGEEPAAMRYLYPTRELLVVRSGAEAIELLGIAILFATAPAVAGMAIGAALWILGGRGGAGMAEMLLGQRLYRSRVGDNTRERWFRLERRMIASGLVIVVVIVMLRGNFF